MDSTIITNEWEFLNEEQDFFTLDLSNATLIECLDKYIEYNEKRHPSVRGNIGPIKDHIRQIEFLSHITIKPKHVTSIFYSKFVDMLAQKGLKYSTISKLCSSIRAVLSWASDYSAIIHPSYKSIDVNRYYAMKMSLTADDVSRIYHFDYDSLNFRPQHIRVLKRVKDMFVLGCNLGQRHSDLIRIERGCFQDGRLIILQQKTKNRANVDLRELSLDRRTTFDILERYDYQAPYKGDLSNYNKHIHQIASAVFKDETFPQQTIIGNDATIIEVKKSKMIASHTARRTFATHNYLIKKLPAQDVMRATGHTSEKSFYSYICGNED